VKHIHPTRALDVSTRGILGIRVQERAFISAIVLVLEKVRGSQDGRVKSMLLCQKERTARELGAHTIGKPDVAEYRLCLCLKLLRVMSIHCVQVFIYMEDTRESPSPKHLLPKLRFAVALVHVVSPVVGGVDRYLWVRVGKPTTSRAQHHAQLRQGLLPNW